MDVTVSRENGSDGDTVSDSTAVDAYMMKGTCVDVESWVSSLSEPANTDVCFFLLYQFINTPLILYLHQEETLPEITVQKDVFEEDEEDDNRDFDDRDFVYPSGEVSDFLILLITALPLVLSSTRKMNISRLENATRNLSLSANSPCDICRRGSGRGGTLLGARGLKSHYPTSRPTSWKTLRYFVLLSTILLETYHICCQPISRSSSTSTWVPNPAVEPFVPQQALYVAVATTPAQVVLVAKDQPSMEGVSASRWAPSPEPENVNVPQPSLSDFMLGNTTVCFTLNLFAYLLTCMHVLSVKLAEPVCESVGGRS